MYFVRQKLDNDTYVNQVIRTAFFHHGVIMRWKHFANHPVFKGWHPRRIAERAELLGHPVWTSCPDEAMKPF